jgi:hypothetical protein
MAAESDRATKPYGNVAYADPKNGAYPIDTAAHAKAAWSYINMPKNAAKYPKNGVSLSSVKSRIMAACKKFGITISQGNSAPLSGEFRDDMGNVMTAAAGGLDDVARQYCASQGWAMQDGTYPIRPLNWHGAADLDAAIAKATSGGYNDGARRHIMRRAAAIGLAGSVPASWGNAGNDTDDTNSAAPGGEYRTVTLADPLAVRDGNGDGLTFEGYAAVYNTPTRIQGWDDDFDEQIAPGAFRAIAAGKYPALMFDHGKHPLIGTMPLGRITAAREDPRGLHITARLTDNWLIQPVRDAVRDQAVTGMSFRFSVDDGGDTWLDRQGDVPLRTLTSVSVPELGPVVFPAYEPTTASVRSALDRFPPDFTGRAAARSAAGGEQVDVQPGKGGPSPNPRTVLRDRAWRMRRQLHG